MFADIGGDVDVPFFVDVAMLTDLAAFLAGLAAVERDAPGDGMTSALSAAGDGLARTAGTAAASFDEGAVEAASSWARTAGAKSPAPANRYTVMNSRPVDLCMEVSSFNAFVNSGLALLLDGEGC